MNIEELETQFEQAVADFEALKAEQSRLPLAFNEASRTGDAGELVRLTVRKTELAQLVFASEVAALRAHQALLEGQTDELKAAMVPLRADVQKAESEVKQANDKLAAARQAHGRLDGRESSIRHKRLSLKRQIDDLIAAQVQTDMRRPVYSLQHVSTR